VSRWAWLIGFLGCAASLAAQTPPAELTAAHDRLRDSLETLDALILSGPKHGPVYDIYQEIRPELSAKRVQFVIDEASSNVVDGVSVEPNPSAMRVHVSLGIIKMDRANTGFLLGYLCEGFAFLHAVLKANQKPYAPDSIQKVYDSMDALFLHAVFLRDYAMASGKSLHPFERYLIESLQNDAASNLAPMSGAAMYLLSLDAQVLYSFSELGGEAQRGQVTVDDYLSKMTKLAGRLTEALTNAQPTNAKASPTVVQLESQYISEVSALTMLSYGVAIVNVHLARFFPKADTQQVKGLTDLNTALDKLGQLANAHTASLTYRDAFLKKLNL
jgi:hypothetical protein